MLKLKAQGFESPALRNRPTLKPENEWLLDAYYTLSRSRQVGGMGEFFIPLTEFQAYCEMFEISSSEDRQFLTNVVGMADAILLNERYEEREKSAK